MHVKASIFAKTGACCTLFWLLGTVLFAGLFGWAYASRDKDEAFDMRSSYLTIDNVFPVAFREILMNQTHLPSTRDYPAFAYEWNILFQKFTHQTPCLTRPGVAVGEVWIAPGDACWLAENSETSAVGARLRGTGACNNTVFAGDYTLYSHFLVCLELTEYNYLRTSDHCYDEYENNSLRITDNRLRSVCWFGRHWRWLG